MSMQPNARLRLQLRHRSHNKSVESDIVTITVTTSPAVTSLASRDP